MNVNKYFALMYIRLRLCVQYPFALASAFLQTMIQIVIVYTIWNSAFSGKSMISGFSKHDMMTYSLLSQSISMIYGYSNSPDRLIAKSIRDGNISLELIRPIRFTTARFFENLGDTLINIFFTVILATFLFLVFPEFSVKFSLLNIFLFVISTALGYVILFNIYSIAGYATFYTMNFWGIHSAQKAIMDFLSGSLIPIALFPIWAQKISMILPFQNIIYTPVMIYMGKLSLYDGITAIILQIFWSLFLCFICRMVYKLAVRRITINGG